VVNLVDIMLKGIGVKVGEYHCKLKKMISISLNLEIDRVLEKNWPLFNRAPWKARFQFKVIHLVKTLEKVE